MIINCIIIDDEPLARKGLAEYVDEIDFLRLTGSFGHPLKATDILATGEVQLLLMDIQMPVISGIDFVKISNHLPPVIFTTAYPNHALQGFELEALDYLVKPISFERFYKAALKAKSYYDIREKNVALLNSQADYVFVKADNKLVKIMLQDILFVEGLQNYVCIHTIEKKYITYLTFKSIEESLPASLFIKVHKSYIVAPAKVDSIAGNEIQVGTHKLPISRNLKDAVMEKLLKGKYLKR